MSKRLYNKEQYKEYRNRNAEKIAAYNKEYRKTHRNQLLDYGKEYYRTHKEEHKARGAQYFQRNKEKMRLFHRNYYLISKFGITLEDYENMFISQNGLCAICGLPPTEDVLVVDHEHLSGNIRGLLCQKCNKAIGFFNDSTSILTNAIDYLNHSDIAHVRPM